MRMTINISDEILKEAMVLYNSKNKSKVIETALSDAIRREKLQRLKSFKGKIEFDIEKNDIESLRGLELDE